MPAILLLDSGNYRLDCYNGYGHIVNEEKPLAIIFTPDSVSEASLTNVIYYK